MTLQMAVSLGSKNRGPRGEWFLSGDFPDRAAGHFEPDRKKWKVRDSSCFQVTTFA